MNFTKTSDKAAAIAEKEYTKSAPLVEKKKKVNLTIVLNEKERQILDDFLDTHTDPTGRRTTRSTFARSAIFQAINRAQGQLEPAPEWEDEPFTLEEASEKFGIPIPTIKSAIQSKNFGDREIKKITVRNKPIVVVTRKGMERLFGRIK